MTNMSRAFFDCSRDGVRAEDAEKDFSVLAAFASWAIDSNRLALALDCERFGRLSPHGRTGKRLEQEERVRPRQSVLCLAESEEDRFMQLAAVLAVGGRAIWPVEDGMAELLAGLPGSVREWVALADVSATTILDFDVALCHGDEDAFQGVLRGISERDGPIVVVLVLPPGSVEIPLNALVVGLSGENPAEATSAESRRLQLLRCRP
ncbi:hypothetical protein [Variovorax sp. J31P207]|uniref:hypothetical protein n=1 Tax=Variovorax sp. J31P207 TaxID=3053510 RepID=UPI002574EBB7|nr:hypothetical protein [Variovorax sp. J31P207]MDM0065269.1 hypothetical protein [Variovorax sp. J31P207]